MSHWRRNNDHRGKCQIVFYSIKPVDTRRKLGACDLSGGKVGCKVKVNKVAVLRGSGLNECNLFTNELTVDLTLKFVNWNSHWIRINRIKNVPPAPAIRRKRGEGVRQVHSRTLRTCEGQATIRPLRARVTRERLFDFMDARALTKMWRWGCVYSIEFTARWCEWHEKWHWIFLSLFSIACTLVHRLERERECEYDTWKVILNCLGYLIKVNRWNFARVNAGWLIRMSIA